jgi:hypothetical protein
MSQFRYVETIDNQSYEVLQCGKLKYTVQRESGTTPNGNVYSEQWVARNRKGKVVGAPNRYRNDLFEQLEMRA